MTKYVYRLGVALFFIGLTAVILQNTGILNLTELLYPCVFRQMSGIYCPGCGGTRAVKALLGGHIFSCLFYHPFVFYFFLMYVLFMGSHTLEKISHRLNAKKAPHKTPFVRGLSLKVSYIYIGIIIIFLQWIIKNVALLLSFI